MCRTILTVALIATLVSPALAQGVVFSVYPATAALGQPVQATLHNKTTSTIYASPGGWTVLDSQKRVVYSPPGGPPGLPVLPGKFYSWGWRQVDNYARQVSPGAYEFRTVYQLQNMSVVTVSRGLQIQDASLEVSGAASPGSRVLFKLHSPKAGGLPYRTALSFSDQWGIPLPGKRLLPLAPDPLFFISATSALPMFGNFVGTLDATGAGTSWLDIPRDLRLLGLRFHAAFVAFSPSSAGGIHSFSSAESLQIQ